MAKRFSAQVQDQVRLVKRRMLAVKRQSTQDVINLAQTPVAKGGRMRVDTGFLRASGRMSMQGLPRGNGVNPGTPGQEWNEDDVLLFLADTDLGETIYFGWVANYARPREFKDGFLRGAAEKWQSVVNKNVRRASREIR